MSIQLTIKIGSKDYNVFLSNDFNLPYTKSKYLHKHKYSEIHLITGGNATFNINNQLHLVKKGTILVIPPDVFHCYLNKEDTALRAAFQIDCNIGKVYEHPISPDTVSDFFLEADVCKRTGDYTKFSAYITLFCSYIHQPEPFLVKSSDNYGFLIQDFISKNYGEDLHLSDLASFLHLSERHTERLVIEHTGRPFRKTLAETRMDIAKQLLKSTDMTLTEIAEHIGYKSYAGFWKAAKKYNL